MVSLCWQVCRSPDLNRLVPLADEMPLAAPLLPVVPFDQRWNCERKLFQERQGWFLLTSPGRRVAVFYVGLRGNGHALCLTETARQVLQLPASAILHDSWQPVRALLLSNGFPFQAQDAAVYSLDIQVQSLGPPCVTVRVVGATEVVLKARRPRRSAKARMDDSCTEASLSDGANAEASDDSDVQSLDTALDSEAAEAQEEPDSCDERPQADVGNPLEDAEDVQLRLPKGTHVVVEHSNPFFTLEDHYKAGPGP